MLANEMRHTTDSQTTRGLMCLGTCLLSLLFFYVFRRFLSFIIIVSHTVCYVHLLYGARSHLFRGLKFFMLYLFRHESSYHSSPGYSD